MLQVPVLAVADVLWMLLSKRGEGSASHWSKGLGCLTPMGERLPWPVQSLHTHRGHDASTGGSGPFLTAGLGTKAKVGSAAGLWQHSLALYLHVVETSC